MKKYRKLIQFGTFYRLSSPFENNISAWMAVSPDKRQAIIGLYRTLSQTNAPYSRLLLKGLDEGMEYAVEGDKRTHYGDELMNAGLITSDASCGEMAEGGEPCRDFDSKIYVLNAV